MEEEPVLRTAEFADVNVMALFRRLMFAEMDEHEQLGYDPVELGLMEAVFREHLRAHLGEDVRGWVITVAGRIVAAAAVSVLPIVPAPGRLDMRWALLHNVYVLPEFRRRGLARQLVETARDWCKAEGFTRMSLNASQAGRPLYEAMGFHPTNQMSLDLR